MIRIVSFSYKHGMPPRDHLVFDCLMLPNPYHVPKLRPLDGRDDRVKTWLVNAARTMTSMIVNQAADRAQAGHNIAFGCVGGQHRSVACAEMTAALLRFRGHEVEVQHTALTKEG